MRANLTMALLLAAGRSGINDAVENEAYRLRPPPVIHPPPPPVAVCSVCGLALWRYRYAETGADPSRKCLDCIEATPGRERMAAKRARRAKRDGVNHHGREA